MSLAMPVPRRTYDYGIYFGAYHRSDPSSGPDNDLRAIMMHGGKTKLLGSAIAVTGKARHVVRIPRLRCRSTARLGCRVNRHPFSIC
eukprot:479249-Prymnesium_polylepis.1